ncbi:glycosyltransferase [Coprococcus sp. OM04-5BH]|nr:glycosyltransferase [Coprococcus sp. OM04-5BH]
MRVLMINKFLYPNGGSETYIFKLGKYLENQGHEVQYFGMEHEGRCVGNSVNAYTSDMDFHGGSKLAKLTYPIKTIYSKEARVQLRKVLDDFKPDVCHLNNFNYQLTPSMILEIVKWRKDTGRDCRIVFTAHDYQLVCPNHMCNNPNTHENCEKCLGGKFINCTKGKCIHGSTAKSAVGTMEAEFWKLKGTYKYIDTMICCSKFMKSKLDSNPLFAKKTVAMHNFIDKVEWKETQKKDYVLYFGRFSEEKGIGTLIKVCRELPDVKFIFAGTGPLEDSIKNIPNIENVGFKTGEELEKLIREARFSVYPSEWYENCPFSVMESQMYGTPVLGANIGGIPELIQVGRTGELFESGNAVDLKNKIQAMWNDKQLLDGYSENCKDIKFSTIDEYCKKLIRIYNGRKKKHDKGISPKKGNGKMAKTGEKKLNGTVIVTYRCNARCSMCNRYKAPSKPEEEISIETIRKLPNMYFTNITGGEPFIRTDLKDIVRELYKKSDRIVISTNGFFTDRIVDLCKEFPQIGIRISIEGLEQTNNEIRGLQDGYQRGYKTLKTLRKMGMKDVGFGMTVQDKNAPDLVPLYKISDKMGMEFATASLHNSFYFVEAKNIIKDRPMVAKNFEALVNELLRSNSPKKWFRAYFNHGLINYIYGQKRLLPCDMSFDTFFIDPYGDVMPCNGTKDKEVMGNLNEQSWDELWNSREAEAVRKKVRCCDRDCWMIGSVSPAMHKYIWKPGFWVLKHKFKALFSKHPYSMYELKICRDYRDGKVTKEQLDKCSTCDICATINDGLSAASKAQLVGKTGEEIVDADIAKQMEKK